MKRRVPGIVDVVPEPTLGGKLLLKFKDGSFKDPFVDRFVSDGTIKMFSCRCIVFEGKQDLEKQLVRRIRGYRAPGAQPGSGLSHGF